ncbi:MAG: glycosyltransferase [Candidatus Niyogibacteria bacterium]|nr:glycosyltransferase [Candidatus Niyogibacteria bacterium]
MKLLIVTQKVDLNDDNLGFFHRWLEEFAKNAEQIFVITQFLGEHDLPANVEIYSLGKERGLGRTRRYWNFYKYSLKILPRVDAVFVHMIPMWVLLLWKPAFIFRKKMYLWYTHKSVTWSLRLAEKMVEKIFTASRESFRLPSKKAEIMGHGIDTDYFILRPESRSLEIYRIISVGRISSSKRIKEMILAMGELRKILPPGKKFEFAIIGSPKTHEDEDYFVELKNLVREFQLGDRIKFIGGVPHKNIVREYQKSHLFLNFSVTGSVDKAVLEAMSCGTDVLVANEAFFGMLPEENIIKKLWAVRPAERIKEFMLSGRHDQTLREIVLKNHNLKLLIKKIVNLLQEE